MCKNPRIMQNLNMEEEKNILENTYEELVRSVRLGSQKHVGELADRQKTY